MDEYQRVFMHHQNTRVFTHVLLRAKKVGHQISVNFEKFDVVQALLSFCL
jgi:predicted glycosyltransferase